MLYTVAAYNGLCKTGQPCRYEIIISVYRLDCWAVQPAGHPCRCGRNDSRKRRTAKAGGTCCYRGELKIYPKPMDQPWIICSNSKLLNCCFKRKKKKNFSHFRPPSPTHAGGIWSQSRQELKFSVDSDLLLKQFFRIINEKFVWVQVLM